MTERAEPVRTCVGCRRRTVKSDLLRVVVDEAVTETVPRPARRLVPDPRGRRPGRGAHLHPDPDCLALAIRRRAFGRAFRLDGPFDASPVAEWVATGSVPERADSTMSAR